MAGISRLGTALLLLGGTLLSCLLAYALWLDPSGQSAPLRPNDTTGLALVMPDWSDWLDFAQEAAQVCDQVGSLKLVRSLPTELFLETPRGRSLKLFWMPAVGTVETREAARTLHQRGSPLAAVIGSSNTQLTLALAHAMNRQWPDPAGSPALIVPWATAIHASLPGESGPPQPLLDRYPSRSFRFGPNNDAMAALVLRCARDHLPTPPPTQVVIVEDPSDPYSTDLATSFQRATAAVAPQASLVSLSTWTSPSTRSDSPGPDDARLAATIWKAAATHPATWLLLPLQDEPTKRLIAALQASAPSTSAAPLPILCGDGIGQQTLAQWRDWSRVSVWCFSTSVAPDAATPLDHLLAAEILTALALACDRPEAAAGDWPLALSRIHLPAADPHAFGRPLSFLPGGERAGDPPGAVLTIDPGSRQVVAYTPRSSGDWSDPQPIDPTPPSDRRSPP